MLKWPDGWGRFANWTTFPPAGPQNPVYLIHKVQKETIMTKLTPAQAYAAQVKADRRAAVLERKGDVALQAETARVREMYKKVAPAKTEPPAETRYLLTELDQIPDEVARNRAYQLAALWPLAVPGVAFPGVLFGFDRHRKVGNWYVNNLDLPGDLPAMICSNNRLTQEVGCAAYVKVGNRGYRYATVTLRTALARAKRGKELFNFGA